MAQNNFIGGIMTILCAGKGQAIGVGRKMAVKSNGQKNEIPKQQYMKDSVNLNGCAQDDATMSHWIKKKNESKATLKLYKSVQSVNDALLTVSSAKERIVAFLKEEPLRIKKVEECVLVMVYCIIQILQN